MTVHFFTFSDERGGSSRHRAFWMVEKLRVRGMDAVIHAPPVLDISRTRWPKKGILVLQVIRSLFSIRKGDVVYLQRATYNKYFFIIMAAYLFATRRKVIFDFDDPIYLHSYLKTKIFTRMAHAVVVCTHGQAAWAQQFNPNVYVVHIAVASDEYEKFTKDYTVSPKKLTIGWTGVGPEHMKNLPLLVPVLKKLAQKNEYRFKFMLIGTFGDARVCRLFSIPGLEVEFVDRADPKSMPSRIQQFDIGVVPHQHEGEWNKSKTSLKVLEYMACGVAAVSSNFGEIPYIITDGLHGYLASTAEEWVEKLEALLRDPALRARLGRAGQRRIKEHFSYEVVAPRLEEIIRKVADS